MLRTASVICIVYALHYLTVDTYRRTWMGNRTRVRIAASFVKTLAARIFAVAGVLPAYLNVPLAAALVLIIRTAYSSTI